MYTVIRRYIVQAGAAEQIAERVREELLPSLGELPGFIAYYLVSPDADTVVSVSVFETREGVDSSTRTATEWARGTLGHLVRSAPVIVTGKTLVHQGAVPQG